MTTSPGLLVFWFSFPKRLLATTAHLPGIKFPYDLRYLDLSKTKVSGDICEMRLPKSITHLDLSDTNVTGSLDNKRWPTNLETLIISSCSIEGSLHAMRFPWKLRHLDASETPIHVDLVKACPVLPDSIQKLVLQDMHDCTGILPATVLRLCQSMVEGGRGLTFDLSRNTFEIELDMNPSVLAGVKAIRVDESRLGQVRLKGSLPSFRECMDIDSIMFTSFISAGITKFESEFFYSMNVKEIDLTGCSRLRVGFPGYFASRPKTHYVGGASNLLRTLMDYAKTDPEGACDSFEALEVPTEIVLKTPEDLETALQTAGLPLAVYSDRVVGQSTKDIIKRLGIDEARKEAAASPRSSPRNSASEEELDDNPKELREGHVASYAERKLTKGLDELCQYMGMKSAEHRKLLTDLLMTGVITNNHVFVPTYDASISFQLPGEDLRLQTLLDAQKAEKRAASKEKRAASKERRKSLQAIKAGKKAEAKRKKEKKRKAEAFDEKDPKFVKFLAKAKDKDYFKGAKEGTPDYKKRYDKVVAKFCAKIEKDDVELTAAGVKLETKSDDAGGEECEN